MAQEKYESQLSIKDRDSPVVSVVIPYSPKHTPEEMLEEAKRSAKSQSVATDIIVVEDTDQHGPAWARNKGIEQSCTRFVAFLDADDHWLDGKLEKQLRKLNQTGAGICLEGKSRSYESFLRDVMAGKVQSMTSSIVIDSEQVDIRFEEELDRQEDHLFILEAASKNGVCFCDDLVEIRKHPNGLSANTSGSIKLSERKRFEQFVQQRIEGASEHLYAYRAHTHYTVGRLFHHEGKHRAAIQQFVRSLQFAFRTKTAVALLWSSAWWIIKSCTTRE